jgi:hypothetical protein
MARKDIVGTFEVKVTYGSFFTVPAWLTVIMLAFSVCVCLMRYKANRPDLFPYLWLLLAFFGVCLLGVWIAAAWCRHRDKRERVGTLFEDVPSTRRCKSCGGYYRELIDDECVDCRH